MPRDDQRHPGDEARSAKPSYRRQKRLRGVRPFQVNPAATTRVTEIV